MQNELNNLYSKSATYSKAQKKQGIKFPVTTYYCNDYQKSKISSKKDFFFLCG